MVTFELLEKTDRKITWLYHPENDRDAEPGVIAVYPDRQVIVLEKAAERDSVHVTTVEDMNKMRDSINAARQTEGLPELTGEELPRPTYDETYYYYASHAVRTIRKKLDSGQVPDNGISAWY